MTKKNNGRNGQRREDIVSIKLEISSLNKKVFSPFLSGDSLKDWLPVPLFFMYVLNQIMRLNDTFL